MQNEKNIELCNKFLTFLFHLKCWMNSNYMKNFNINGKGDFELTERQFEILITLKILENGTVSDLEERLHVTSSSLSTTISKMVNLGYIERSFPQGQEDRRKTYLHITKKGINIIEDIHKKLIQAIDYFYENLNEDQKNSFSEGVDKLVQIFDDKD
jgi:DNA-binding MarR family transcriptional regulator